MAAYIDEYRNRFKVGPICRVYFVKSVFRV